MGVPVRGLGEAVGDRCGGEQLLTVEPGVEQEAMEPGVEQEATGQGAGYQSVRMLWSSPT